MFHSVGRDNLSGTHTNSPAYEVALSGSQLSRVLLPEKRLMHQQAPPWLFSPALLSFKPAISHFTFSNLLLHHEVAADK